MSDLQYKCPACGAPISFDPQRSAMVCGYCGSTFSVAEVEKYNQQLGQGSSSQPEQAQQPQQGYQTVPSGQLQAQAKDPVYLDEVSEQKLARFVCDSCGGDIVGSPELVSSACPYCGNNFIAPSQLERTRLPDRMIPFKVTPEQMVENFLNATKKLWFLPTDFRAKHKLIDSRGVYLPYWLFDCYSDGRLEASGTKTTSWTSGNYRHTRTDHYRIARVGGAAFQDVPVSGTKDVEPARTEAIEPFDYLGSTDFATAYLAGYATNTYNIDHQEANVRANQRVVKSLEELLMGTIKGYDSVSVDSCGVRVSDAVVEYVFLPVYLMNLQYGGKIYPFAVNGQTGKVAGQFPIVQWKRVLFFFAIMLLIALLLVYPMIMVLGGG